MKPGLEEQDWIGEAARGAGAEAGCRAACCCWGPALRRPGLQQSIQLKRPGVTWKQQAQAGPGPCCHGVSMLAGALAAPP